ncbi:hypothetical protein [Myroides indicus]|uniref:MORN repeat protein n=1 Tax=Myroides indicus TaxID=1323422 RepID=A0A4V3E8V1_9FLAO|nr:hypothetical protein [Myroides indicus]TDS62065.1 hypothetical protein C8P70_10731 [Myroides indicus]
MKKNYLTIILLLLLFTSCRVNQKKYGEKVGRWVFKTTIDKDKDVHRGRYDQKGFQKGTWRYRLNGKIYKKEQFNNKVAYVTEYHKNGTIAALGQTRLEIVGDGLHWYYFGSWFIYNTKGELTDVKHYELGIEKHHTKVRP